MTEIGEESRQRILDAAEELFLERGYEKTTLSAIGERCGISYGSIPWHFGNKAGLLYAVVTRIIDPYSSAGLGEGRRLTPGREGLDQMVSGHVLWDNHPKLELLFMLDHAYTEAPAEVVEEMLKLDNRWHATIELWVTQTLDGRPLPPGVTESGVARFISAASRGIGLARRLGGSQVDIPGAREAYYQSIVSLLGLGD
jgi:TetR/AcrR family acrAB operon transcriptional repressor